MNEPHRIAAFRGGVSCRRDPHGPLGITLIGRTTDQPEEVAFLALAAQPPPGLPEALEDVVVDRLGDNRYRISSARREWIVPARSAHLHREVATTFYRAVTPRVVPWNKRLFWRLVLAMAAHPTGRRLLLALRRR
jgi:hypothetical protein